jgi:NADH-quinone oxidoreductase subunit M
MLAPIVFGTGLLGVWIMQRGAPARARTIAIAAALVLTVIGTILAGWIHFAQQPWTDSTALALVGEARPLFGLDDFNAPLLPFSSALVLILLVGLPRARTSAALAGGSLVHLAATWTLFASLDLGLIAVAWLVSAWPAITMRHGARRIVAAYMLASAGLVFVAVVLIAIAARRAGVAAPLSLPDLQAIGGAALEPWRVLPLLLTAIVIRKGAFPFHSWIPALSSHAGPAAPALLVGPQVGAFVLVRCAIPLFPDAMAEAIPIVGRVALLAALYGAFVGLAASDLRRVYGWLVVSQSSLVLVGLECTDVDGIAGGLTLWLSAGLALTALGVVIEAVEARVGVRSLDRFSGLRAPRLGALFLVLGLACVGLPGTLGFVAEDLLVHGVLESYPGIGAVIIVATAANGFSVMRAFVRTFYGPVDRDVAVSDVLPRESIVLGGAAVLLVVAGLWPRPILDTRSPVAERLSALVSAHDPE